MLFVFYLVKVSTLRTIPLPSPSVSIHGPNTSVQITVDLRKDERKVAEFYFQYSKPNVPSTMTTLSHPFEKSNCSLPANIQEPTTMITVIIENRQFLLCNSTSMIRWKNNITKNVFGLLLE